MCNETLITTETFQTRSSVHLLSFVHPLKIFDAVRKLRPGEWVLIPAQFHHVNIESMSYSVLGDTWAEGWDLSFFNTLNNSLINVKSKLYISGILNHKNQNFNLT